MTPTYFEELVFTISTGARELDARGRAPLVSGQSSLSSLGAPLGK